MNPCNGDVVYPEPAKDVVHAAGKVIRHGDGASFHAGDVDGLKKGLEAFIYRWGPILGLAGGFEPLAEQFTLILARVPREVAHDSSLKEHSLLVVAVVGILNHPFWYLWSNLDERYRAVACV